MNSITNLLTFDFQPCERKWRIVIPDKYITHGSRQPKMVFDLGNVNAEVELDGETRDCLH